MSLELLLPPINIAPVSPKVAHRAVSLVSTSGMFGPPLNISEPSASNKPNYCSIREE